MSNTVKAEQEGEMHTGREEASGLNFGQALELLKQGAKVSRAGWNGKGMWLALQRPDANSKMTLPYIYMSTVTGALVPWLASQADMLADDWDTWTVAAQEPAR